MLEWQGGMRLRLVVALCLGFAACTGDSAAPFDDPSVAGKADSVASASDLPPPPAEAHAVLDLYALDLWAQPLPRDAKLTIEVGGSPVPLSTWPIVRVPLDRAAGVVVRLSAPYHEPLEVRLGYDGTDGLDGVLVNRGDDGRAGVSLGHNRKQFGARSLPVHSLYLGLRHQFFSAQGRPARRGNDLTLFLDGEHAWESVAGEIQQAQKSVSIATWWFESNFELVRPKQGHIELTTEQRRRNTILSILEQSAATKRVLINQLVTQDGLFSDLTSDDAVRAHGPDADDNFELLGQHNAASGNWAFVPKSFLFKDRLGSTTYATDKPIFDAEPSISINFPEHQVEAAVPLHLPLDHASMHQKFAVVDEKVAFIGGMNLRVTDWDTAEHKVFEPRREPFNTSRADRDAIDLGQKLGKQGPRKDYMMRIEGPAVQDASDVFARRWDQALSDNVDYAYAATSYDVERHQPAKGSAQAQVTATLPAPYDENAIGESWLNAVAHAEKYIYIEDQYFRAELLNDAILKRMIEKPELKLVVITKPISEWTDPGCEWTYRSNDLFAGFADRYLLLQLRAFDYGWDIDGFSDKAKGTFLELDVHSKVLMVDDVFLSVGSANKNNRGMLYEGELNIAVVDQKLVRDWRRRILQNLLPSGVTISDDADHWWTQLLAAAGDNDQAYSNWQSHSFRVDFHGEQPSDDYLPRGFVYTMQMAQFPECAIEGVSADLM